MYVDPRLQKLRAMPEILCCSTFRGQGVWAMSSSAPHVQVRVGSAYDSLGSFWDISSAGEASGIRTGVKSLALALALALSSSAFDEKLQHILFFDEDEHEAWESPARAKHDDTHPYGFPFGSSREE